jgi:hypothetical protein
MKRLFILLAIMGVGVYLLLSENDEKNYHGEKKMKKKTKKSHFPKKEPEPA